MLVSLSDSLSIVSKLTPKRVANASKIWTSYHRSRKSGTASIKGLPISIAIEPTTACNLRCPECPSGLRSFSRPTGTLNAKLFGDIIEQVKEHLLYLTFYFQGEPFLHPDFLKMVKIASKEKIYTTTSTNAHFLTKEKALEVVRSGLNRLIISIDGATQETYSAYRKGGSLEKVLDGTRNIVEARRELDSSSPTIIWQFLVVQPNEHEIETIKQLAKEYGIDKVAFKTAQIYDYQKGSPLIPTIDQYSRYKQNEDGTFAIKNPWQNQCWKMWHSCVITWDGQVIPCCFDKDATHSFGNVKDASFRDIWFSESYQSFRNTLLHSRSSIEICKNCSEGLKVWA